MLVRVWRNKNPQAGRIIKGCNWFANSLAVSQKVKNTITTLLIMSALKCKTKRNENICPYRNLYTNVHSSIICNGQKVKTIWMFINWWMNNQNVVYLYQRLLLSHEKKLSINTGASGQDGGVGTHILPPTHHIITNL